MRVLVTGASGFVGRSLCAHLANQGHQVTAVVRTAATAEIIGASRTQRVGEIGPDTDWLEALDNQDAIFHLAARAHVMAETLSDPEPLYRRVNVDGTRRLVDQAIKRGVRRLIFLSSIKVNGEGNQATPYTELMQTAPEDAYGRTKRDAEILIKSDSSLLSTIIRAPLVYGPGVKGNFLKLLSLCEKPWPIPLGSIKNQRSLLFLGNLVDALSRTLKDDKSINQTYLVSDGDDLSTTELVRSIGSALNAMPLVLPFPVFFLRSAGAMLGKSAAVDRLCGSLRVDSTHIQQHLSWKPPFSAQQGLEITAEWFQNQSEPKMSQKVL